MRDNGDFEAVLAAAAGHDPELQAELLASFHDSLALNLDLLGRARCDANWLMAAQRLRGLGASFHAAQIVRLAEEAIDGAPGDPVVQRKLAAASARFAPES